MFCKINMAQPMNLSGFTKTELDVVFQRNDIFFTEPFDSFANLTQLSTQNGNELPQDMKFNDGHRLAVIGWPLLMILSVTGNFTIFVMIVRLRAKGNVSRTNLFLLHLAIADLIVTFFMMPLEIGWNATVSWKAGDVMCRFMSFLRIFGLYLSSFILICISIDRYHAILKPLGNANANSRARNMISLAWVSSFVCSVPQTYIFHVEKYPKFRLYEQCVTFNSFPSPKVELAYNVFGFLFLYGFPLVIIIYCYTCILLEICRINKQEQNGESLRRSNFGALARAKTKTLKVTVIIVATFFLCWTPYNIMSLWYWFDKESAQSVDPRIQKALFMFACANSCVNPLVYGMFHLRRTEQSTPNPGLVSINNPSAAESNSFTSIVLRKLQQCCGKEQSTFGYTRQRLQPQSGHSQHYGSSRCDVTISISPVMTVGQLSTSTHNQTRSFSPNRLAPCQPSTSFLSVEWDGNAARVVTNRTFERCKNKQPTQEKI